MGQLARFGAGAMRRYDDRITDERRRCALWEIHEQQPDLAAQDRERETEIQRLRYVWSCIILWVTGTLLAIVALVDYLVRLTAKLQTLPARRARTQNKR
jgi:hypothetical protein